MSRAQWDKAAGEIAGKFFETGPVKRFFDEWDPELRAGQSHDQHYEALKELARGVLKARTEYMNTVSKIDGSK